MPFVTPVKTEFPTWDLLRNAGGRVVEFARNVCGLEGANTTEVDPGTPHGVIGMITEWLDASGNVEQRGEDSDLGGTMRLGGQRCRLKEGSLARKLYGQEIVTERHRHRYEFNNNYRDILQKHGMLLSGLSMDEMLVEIIEIPDPSLVPGLPVPPGIYLHPPRWPPPVHRFYRGGLTRAAG